MYRQIGLSNNNVDEYAYDLSTFLLNLSMEIPDETRYLCLLGFFASPGEETWNTRNKVEIEKIHKLRESRRRYEKFTFVHKEALAHEFWNILITMDRKRAPFHFPLISAQIGIQSFLVWKTIQEVISSWFVHAGSFTSTLKCKILVF